jgi:cytochrome c
MVHRVSILIVGLMIINNSGANADDADVHNGKLLVEANCAVCHSVAPTGTSPMRDAPALRDITTHYTMAELEDALNEGVATEHPAMPDWHMTPDQAREISAYIMSLTIHGMKKSDLQH